MLIFEHILIGCASENREQVPVFFRSAFTIFAEDRIRFGNFREQVLTIALTFHYL